MTVTVSCSHNVALERDRHIVRVDPAGTVFLWPLGLGEGPLLVFDPADWDDVVSAVNEARQAGDSLGRAPQPDRTACEGVAYAED